MAKYVIEKLKPENYGKCANIWDMDKHPDRTQKWFQEILSGNREVFVCVLDGEYIGEGALVYEHESPDYTVKGTRVYLSRLVVKPECQNQGVGGAIVDFLIDYAKNHGFTEISLGVDKSNAKARSLYAKKGFDTVIFEGADEHGEYLKLLKVLE